jgi:hypothetical protein
MEERSHPIQYRGRDGLQRRRQVQIARVVANVIIKNFNK